MPDWIAQKNVLQVLKYGWQVQRLATTALRTAIQRRFPLAAVQQAIELYQAQPTAGKVLLVADLDQVAIE